jgi:hypothetical protein
LADVKEERTDLAEPSAAGVHACGWLNAIQLSELPAHFKSLQLPASALDADTGKAAQLDGVWTIKN